MVREARFPAAAPLIRAASRTRVTFTVHVQVILTTRMFLGFLRMISVICVGLRVRLPLTTKSYAGYFRAVDVRPPGGLESYRGPPGLRRLGTENRRRKIRKWRKNSLNIIRKCNNSPKMLFSRTYQWRNAGLCKILNVFFVLSCIWTVQTNTSQEFSLPYNLQTLENQYGRESWQFKYANLHRSILNGDVPPKYFIWTCGSSGYSMSQ